MHLDVYSFHSVKGGVGKSTLATLAALGMAHTRPDACVILIDMDLTGTSLADVLPLQAPSWTSRDLPDALFYPPDSHRDREATVAAIDNAEALPFLNDYLLLPHPTDPDHADAAPEAFLWRWEGAPPNLTAIPSSAIPSDVERIIPIIHDEERSAFIQGRLEVFIAALARYAEAQGHNKLVLVFDTPPSIPGLSRAVLSLGLRLGGTPRIPLVDGELLPLALEEAESLRWRACLITTQDLQDRTALLRWLPATPSDEDANTREVLRLIYNRIGNREQFTRLADPASLVGHSTGPTPERWDDDKHPVWLNPEAISELEVLRIFAQRGAAITDEAWSPILSAIDGEVHG